MHSLPFLSPHSYEFHDPPASPPSSQSVQSPIRAFPRFSIRNQRVAVAAAAAVAVHKSNEGRTEAVREMEGTAKVVKRSVVARARASRTTGPFRKSETPTIVFEVSQDTINHPVKNKFLLKFNACRTFLFTAFKVLGTF